MWWKKKKERNSLLFYYSNRYSCVCVCRYSCVCVCVCVKEEKEKKSVKYNPSPPTSKFCQSKCTKKDPKQSLNNFCWAKLILIWGSPQNPVKDLVRHMCALRRSSTCLGDKRNKKGKKSPRMRFCNFSSLSSLSLSLSSYACITSPVSHSCSFVFFPLLRPYSVTYNTIFLHKLSPSSSFPLSKPAPHSTPSPFPLAPPFLKAKIK